VHLKPYSFKKHWSHPIHVQCYKSGKIAKLGTGEGLGNEVVSASNCFIGTCGKGSKVQSVSRLLSTIVLVGYMLILVKLFNLAQAMGEGRENMTGKLAVK